jgi:hypothetical protein
MLKVTEKEKKTIDTVLKMWNYFGPSPENLGAGKNTAANYLNPDNIVILGTEVGPYMPLVYKQMLNYFAKIFDKLYERGRSRLASDFGIGVNLIPLIKLPKFA